MATREELFAALQGLGALGNLSDYGDALAFLQATAPDALPSGDDALAWALGMEWDKQSAQALCTLVVAVAHNSDASVRKQVLSSLGRGSTLEPSEVAAAITRGQFRANQLA